MTTTDPTTPPSSEELVHAPVGDGSRHDPWSRYWRMAKIVAGTEMVPPALRGRPEAVFALALYAEAVNIHPAIAWQQVAFVNGKPVPSAELQRSLILAAGHRLDIVEMTTARAVVHGTRHDGAELTVTFTLDDADRAGLLAKKGDSWRQYPAAMLLARATSQLARALFPDAIGGMSYLAEELEPARPPTAVELVAEWPTPDDAADRVAADLADVNETDDAEVVDDQDSNVDDTRPF